MILLFLKNALTHLKNNADIGLNILLYNKITLSRLSDEGSNSRGYADQHLKGLYRQSVRPVLRLSVGNQLIDRRPC